MLQSFSQRRCQNEVSMKISVERGYVSGVWLVLAFLVLLGVRPVFAQEAFVNGGFMEDIASSQESYAWSLEYFEAVSEDLGFSFSWINEGHVIDHHRDGLSPQLWLIEDLMDRRLSLRVGIGPYQYFDTTRKTGGGGYEDLHGWGGVYSVAACWYSDSPWIVQLMANYVDARRDIDTASVLLGVGYQLDRPESPGPRTAAPSLAVRTTDQEVTAFLGQTIVNSFDSEHGTAGGVEYRRGLSPHIDGTLAWINEGDTRLVRRNGIAAQLWLTRGFFDNRFTLGVGGGLYCFLDRHQKPVPSEASGDVLAGLITTTGSYRFGKHWLTRFSWNRVVTDYDRDADILLLGLGYRW